MPVLRLALAQTNPRVGDLRANAAAIRQTVTQASQKQAQILVFPEMALTGYPLEDLVQRPAFLSAAHDALDELASDVSRLGDPNLLIIVGLPTGPVSGALRDAHPHAIAHNSAAIIQNGRVLGLYHKHHLPNYSVFDEYRNFIPGNSALAVRLDGFDVGVAICEDMWQKNGPLDELAQIKPGLILVLNGSPFERDKSAIRHDLARMHSIACDAPLAYVNLVGGQDDLVFDGDSFITDARGEVTHRAQSFDEDLLIADVLVRERPSHGSPQDTSRITLVSADRLPLYDSLPPAEPVEPSQAPLSSDLERTWQALVLGLADYVSKNGFPSVILGLSGGIDSAVCASLAVDALGQDRVFCVTMPSKFSSAHSLSDARDSATRLGIHLRNEPISDLVLPIENQLDVDGVAGENLQARIRGIILMSLSNQEGHLTLTTGNKTELAVGYSTIYGDSVGGFAPLKDVPKTLVWE